MSVTINASTTSGLVQSADTSGKIEIQSNGTTEFTIDSTGAYGQLVPATAQTAPFSDTSSINFTSIPSWVKRITITFTDISFAAAGQSRLRLGTSGGLVTSGYVTTATTLTSTPGISFTSVTDGLASVNTAAAATVTTGQFIIVNITGNTWQSNGLATRLADSNTLMSTGYITLGGTLDRLSLVATTSTFDAGTINILYEG
jgi:hypothetical protein